MENGLPVSTSDNWPCRGWDRPVPGRFVSTPPDYPAARHEGVSSSPTQGSPARSVARKVLWIDAGTMSGSIQFLFAALFFAGGGEIRFCFGVIDSLLCSILRRL